MEGVSSSSLQTQSLKMHCRKGAENIGPWCGWADALGTGQVSMPHLDLDELQGASTLCSAQVGPVSCASIILIL